jgi:hypothetical protein
VWPAIYRAMNWTDPWQMDDAACARFLEELLNHPVVVRRALIIRMGGWFDWPKVMETEHANLPVLLLIVILYCIFAGTHRRAWEIFEDSLSDGHFDEAPTRATQEATATSAGEAAAAQEQANTGTGEGAAATAASTSTPAQERAANERMSLRDRVDKLKKKARDVMSHVVEVLSDPVIPDYGGWLTGCLTVLGREHGLVLRLLKDPANVRKLYARWADFGWRQTCVELFCILGNPAKLAKGGLTVAWVYCCLCGLGRSWGGSYVCTTFGPNSYATIESNVA